MIQTFIVGLLTLSSTPVLAGDLSKELKAFYTNPKVEMAKIPEKFDPKGVKAVELSKFKKDSLRTKEYMNLKKNAREGANWTGGTPAIRGRARAKVSHLDFLDQNDFDGKTILNKLSEIEAAGLTASKLDETPWSDDYWPIYKGVLGNRYASPGFMQHSQFNDYYNFVSSSSLKDILDSADDGEIDNLSPSEKFDTLIGGVSASQKMGILTTSNWNEGKRYVKPDGSVETWMGICHGWAPAAFMVGRPKQAVTVNTASNLPVRFYPADVKALASLTWAKNQVNTKFIGGRCNDKDVPTDSNSGRVLSEECFDTNPANWHLIMVNQIGVARRSFVMDATFDYEVWNQPIHGYKYRYFNPLTEREVRSWKDAKVAYADFRGKDPFKRFRQNVASVVGVAMQVTYVVETSPSHDETDSPNSDATRTVEYKYDLELDADDNVIGGEWYTRAHPDFAWLPLKDSGAPSYGESSVSGGPEWDPNSEELPRFWRDIAVRSAGYGQPAEFVVKGLVSAARKQSNRP